MLYNQNIFIYYFDINILKLYKNINLIFLIKNKFKNHFKNQILTQKQTLTHSLQCLPCAESPLVSTFFSFVKENFGQRLYLVQDFMQAYDLIYNCFSTTCGYRGANFFNPI
jgi:hypothetical protein